MAEGSWSDLFKGDGNAALPEQEGYAIEVIDARSSPNSRQVWVDLRVLHGPQAGKVTSVSIYLPDPRAEKFRGQLFNFKKRLAGFNIAAALERMNPEGDVREQLDILGEALTGQKAYADIDLRSDGEYAGTNQLVRTKPMDDTPAPTAASAAAPADVTPAAVPAEPAPANEPAMAGEVPF